MQSDLWKKHTKRETHQERPKKRATRKHTCTWPFPTHQENYIHKKRSIERDLPNDSTARKPSRGLFPRTKETCIPKKRPVKRDLSKKTYLERPKKQITRKHTCMRPFPTHKRGLYVRKKRPIERDLRSELPAIVPARSLFPQTSPLQHARDPVPLAGF